MVGLIVVAVVVVAVAVGAYLFLKHNPAKKAAIDAAEQKAVSAVTSEVKKL